MQAINDRVLLWEAIRRIETMQTYNAPLDTALAYGAVRKVTQALRSRIMREESTRVEEVVAVAIREFNWSNYGLDDFPVEEEVVDHLAKAIAERLMGPALFSSDPAEMG